MRSLSLDMRTALFAQESGKVAVALITITHPTLASPLYLSSDATERLSTDPLVYGTISRGNSHLYVAPEVYLPDEKDREPPQSKLIISNVSRDYIDLVRSISSPASFKIELVLSDAPDDVEIEYPAMQMTQVEFDAMTMTFTLSQDAMALEPYPAHKFTPSYFPALFN